MLQGGNKMHILMYAPICRMNNKAVEGFLKQHYSDDNVLVYNQLEKCSFRPKIKKENIFSIKLMTRHLYGKIRGYENAIPLSNDLLCKMSRYEGEVYKMMDAYFPQVRAFDDRQRIYFQALKLFNSIIVNHQIDVYVMYGIPHQIFDFIIYSLCKIKGIPIIMTNRPMVTGYTYYLYDLEDNFHGKEIAKKANLEDLTKEFKNNFLLYHNSTNGVKPYYMPQNTIKAKVDIFRDRVKAFNKYANSIMDGVEVIKLRLKKKKLEMLIKKLSVEVDYSKKYIYFGLHYQPEGTTSPCAGYFANQQLAIHILAESVPEDVYIYVKEHPAQHYRGEKNCDYFNEISKMRNVVIVPTNSNSNELTKHALAVATCTGTIAYEAMYQNKAALLFGFYIYNDMPNAYTIRSVEDCKEAIKTIINGIDIKDEAIIGYLYSLQSICYHCECTLEMAEFMKQQGITDQENNSINRMMLEDALAGLNL